MKKANGYFKPAYTDPYHYPDDVIAPVVVVGVATGTRYIPDVKVQQLGRGRQKEDDEELKQQPQHVADAPSSSHSLASSSLLLPLPLLSPNSYIRTKLNDDYHIGNKINVMPQLTKKTKQKYFGGSKEDGGDTEKRTKQTRKIGEDNKFNYAVCLRVIHFSRVNQ